MYESTKINRVIWKTVLLENRVSGGLPLVAFLTQALYQLTNLNRTYRVRHKFSDT